MRTHCNNERGEPQVRSARGRVDNLIGAERHGRTAEREACRVGHYDCGMTIGSGEVAIHVPKLRYRQDFCGVCKAPARLSDRHLGRAGLKGGSPR